MSARLRTTLLAGAGFLLLQLGWVLCIAPHYGIDEFDHAYRASSVALGNWEPGNDLVDPEDGRGDLIQVRKDVVEAASPACSARHYTGEANCHVVRDLGDGTVLIASAAARYNPSWYAVAGTLAAPFEGTANLYAMRIVTALLACALFLLTVWLTVAGARTVWPLVAVLLAALPTTIYSTSVAAPNGLELVAGIGTWVALLAVVDTRGAQRRGSAYAALALFVAVVANTHTLGVVWVALTFAAVAFLHGPAHVVRSLLPRSPGERTAAVLGAAAIAFEVVWLVVSGVNDPALEQAQYLGNPVPHVLKGLLLWPLQAIAAYPLRDEPAPTGVYAAMLLVLATFAVLALRRIALRSRTVLTLVLVLAVSYLLPAYLTVRTYHQVGAAWQGRYGMPFTVGVLVLLGAVLDAPGRRAVARARMLAVAAVILTAVAVLWSQWHVVAVQRSDAVLVTDTRWTVPHGGVLVALVVVSAYAWVRAVTVAPPEPPGSHSLGACHGSTRSAGSAQRS